MTIEKQLGVLAGDEEDSRVELVQVAEAGEVPTLELRFQRHAGELGWMTHKRIRMAGGQIPELRAALNLMDPDAREASISATQKAAARSLRLVDADNERNSG
jgi:hypothetical protein